MIIPTNNYILLTVDTKKDEVSAGGIYLPEKQADTPQCGTLIKGQGFPIGCKIYFKRWAGEPVNHNGTDYLLVHIKDVVAFEGGEK